MQTRAFSSVVILESRACAVTRFSERRTSDRKRGSLIRGNTPGRQSVEFWKPTIVLTVVRQYGCMPKRQSRGTVVIGDRCRSLSVESNSVIQPRSSTPAHDEGDFWDFRHSEFHAIHSDHAFVCDAVTPLHYPASKFVDWPNCRRASSGAIPVASR